MQQMEEERIQNNKRLMEAHRQSGKKGLPRGYKFKKTVEQIFSFKLQLRGEGKGMDFLWYSERILSGLLYPYYLKIQRANPHKEVWLIEDNAKLHHRAKMLPKWVAYRRRHGIQTVDN